MTSQLRSTFVPSCLLYLWDSLVPTSRHSTEGVIFPYLLFVTGLTLPSHVPFPLQATLDLIYFRSPYFHLSPGSRPRDCGDLYASGQREDGIYSVFPVHHPAGFQVYCDMTTDGGGWTVSHVKKKDYMLQWRHKAACVSAWSRNTHSVAAFSSGL